MNRLEVSVLAFQEGERWVAQCVEYDIAARADQLTHLPDALARAVMANICMNLDLGREGLEGVPPAPDDIRRLFDESGFKVTTPTRLRKAGQKAPSVRIRDLRVADAA